MRRRRPRCDLREKSFTPQVLMHLLSSKRAFEAGLLATLLLNPNAAFAAGGNTATESEPADVIVPHGVSAVSGPHNHTELPAGGGAEEEPARRADHAGGWSGRAAIGALAAAATMLPLSQREEWRAHGMLEEEAPQQDKKWVADLRTRGFLFGQEERERTEGEAPRKGKKWVAHVSAAYAERQRIILSCLVVVCIAGFYLYLIYLRQVVPIFHGVFLSLLVVLFGLLYEPGRGRYT